VSFHQHSEAEAGFAGLLMAAVPDTASAEAFSRAGALAIEGILGPWFDGMEEINYQSLLAGLRWSLGSGGELGRSPQVDSCVAAEREEDDAASSE
jgi:hypothetical protein